MANYHYTISVPLYDPFDGDWDNPTISVWNKDGMALWELTLDQPTVCFKYISGTYFGGVEDRWHSKYLLRRILKAYQAQANKPSSYVQRLEELLNA